MPLLFSFFSNVEYRYSAVNCINCILKKGMDPTQKVKMIETFLDIDLIKNTLENINSNEFNVEFIEKIAVFYNTIGIELIEAYKKIVTKLSSTMHNADILDHLDKTIEAKFLLLCKFLSHDALTVCQRVHLFARDYIQWLKAYHYSSSKIENLNQKPIILLEIIIEKNKSLSTRYKPENDFYIEFRKSSKVLFDNLVLFNPSIVLHFICDKVVQPLLLNWKAEFIDFANIEIALYYFYLIGEYMNVVGDVKFLENMAKLLITSSISTYQNPLTQSLYFDLIARYEKFYNSSLNNLLSYIIVSFLDERGIRNKSIKIRSKIFKLFNKFIKSYIKSKNNNPNKKKNFIDDILNRIKDFLELDVVYDTREDLIERDLEHLLNSNFLIHKEQIKFPFPLSCSDHFQIYETVTFLIISSPHEDFQKRELLKSLFMKIWNKFNELLEESNTLTFTLQNCDTREKNILYEKRLVIHLHMSHLIDLIVATSKSFSNVNTVNLIGVQNLYLQSLDLCIKSVNANDIDMETKFILQSSTRHLIHRLVVCLDEAEMIPIIPQTIKQIFLISDVNAKLLHELVPLFNQIIPKYKHSWLFQRDITPFLNQIYIPLTHSFFKMIMEANNEADRNNLKKSYYTFVHILFVNNSMRIFFDFGK